MIGAALLAATLRFGSMQEPASDITIKRAPMEKADAAAVVGMTKKRLGDVDVYYRVPPPDELAPVTVIVGRGGTFWRVPYRIVDEGRGDRDATVGFAADPSLPILRFTYVGRGNWNTDEQMVLLDLRSAPSATLVDANSTVAHGNYVLEMAYAPHVFMSCDWDGERSDFVCREALVQRRNWAAPRIAWRVFTLLGDERLTRGRDLTAAEQLLTGRGRTIAGEGFVDPIPFADGIDFFAIPPTGDDLELHGWLVDRRAQRVLPLETIALAPDAPPRKREPAFTFDHEHIDARTLPPMRAGALTVVPFTFAEGKATALFWLGYDGEHASLLRVASDAYERRDRFLRRPASAVSQAIELAPFGATLRVEGEAPEWASDEPLLDEACRYDARVTWKDGFVVERRNVETCGGAERRLVKVQRDGSVRTATLPPLP